MVLCGAAPSATGIALQFIVASVDSGAGLALVNDMLVASVATAVTAIRVCLRALNIGTAGLVYNTCSFLLMRSLLKLVHLMSPAPTGT
jgi:hypothetical protein